MNHKLSMTRVFDDPSPDAQINNSYFNGMIPIVTKTTLSNNDKDQILSLITLLSMKLVSLWEIKEQYKAMLKQVKEELAKSPKGGNDNLHAYTIQSSGLMGWFDVFLVQIKSILDHWVKIPHLLFLVITSGI